MTTPDEQTRCAFTAEDHVEFEAATTSERRFLKDKYGEDVTDYDDPSEFVAATVGKADPNEGRGSASDPDELARDAMTFAEKVEFQTSDFDSPAAFLKDRNGVHPESFENSGNIRRRSPRGVNSNHVR